MSKDLNNKTITRKKVITRFVIIVLYLSLLLYIYYLFIEFGAHPLIIILLIFFIILVTIGPFLRRNKKSLYSRMFPNRKKNQNLTYQKELTNINEKDIVQTQQKIIKPIDLNINYRKPLINKCENCGNIVPNFVKTCPFCRRQIK